jgi:hypothetical protein
LDQGCNAGECPQVGLVATADRTRHQGFDHLFGLIGGQLGLAPRLSFAGKAGFAAFDPCNPPPVGDLSGHSKPSADFESGNIPLEEESGSDPPLFHSSMVTPRWHERMEHG